jgi:hypothetical protein
VHGQDRFHRVLLMVLYLGRADTRCLMLMAREHTTLIRFLTREIMKSYEKHHVQYLVCLPRAQTSNSSGSLNISLTPTSPHFDPDIQSPRQPQHRTITPRISQTVTPREPKTFKPSNSRLLTQIGQAYALPIAISATFTPSLPLGFPSEVERLAAERRILLVRGLS